MLRVKQTHSECCSVPACFSDYGEVFSHCVHLVPLLYAQHQLQRFVKAALNLSNLCQNLALCTAALMYILSRDRLNMDLDRACLELMIKLLELDQDYSAHQDQLTAKEVEKVKEKIRKLCETVHNKHLDLENITVGCS